MAPRPNLYPLKTSKSIVYPSELQNPRTTDCEATKRDGNGPSVPPPLAYTEFLRALSPAFGSPEPATSGVTRWSFGRPLPSPVSLPSTSSSATFPSRGSSRQRTSTVSVPPSPMSAPRSASSSGVRRFRMSSAYPYSPYSPASTQSPQTPHIIRTPLSPAEWRRLYADMPNSSSGRTVSIHHVVTHTITLKRAPALAAPPKGKRRRTHERRDQ